MSGSILFHKGATDKFSVENPLPFIFRQRAIFNGRGCFERQAIRLRGFHHELSWVSFFCVLAGTGNSTITLRYDILELRQFTS